MWPGITLDPITRLPVESDEELVERFYSREDLGYVARISPSLNVAQNLVGAKCWSALRLALSRCGGTIAFSALKQMSQERMDPSDTEALHTLDVLLKYCANDTSADARVNRSALGSAIGSATSLGLLQQFEVLVNCDDPTVRWWLEESCVNLVLKTCSYRLKYYNRPLWEPKYEIRYERNWKPRFNDCLAVAAEAGLLQAAADKERSKVTADNVMTQTMAGVAVAHNQPDLLRFLLHTGGVSTRVLGLLRVHPAASVAGKLATWANDARQLRRRPPIPGYPTVYHPPSAEAIAQDLWDSGVQRLERLCLLQVSRSLRWGPDRQRQLEQLQQIPEVFRDALVFKQKKLLVSRTDS